MIATNKIGFIATLIVVLALSGCATPYKGVLEPPNESWLGESGTRDLLDTLVMNDGVKKEGDHVLEFEFSYVRTGVIENTVQTKTAYGNDLILKQGYKAYAVDFSIATYRSGSAKAINLQANADPVEWCVILEEGATGKEDSKAELYCLLWVSSNEAHYMKSYNDYVYAPHFIGEANGMYGPMPSIQEMKLILDVTLKKIFRIRSISADGIEFVWTETDGTHVKPSSRYKAIKYKWNDKGEAVIENKYIKFVAKKINAEEVEITRL